MHRQVHRECCLQESVRPIDPVAVDRRHAATENCCFLDEIIGIGGMTMKRWFPIRCLCDIAMDKFFKLVINGYLQFVVDHEMSARLLHSANGHLALFLPNRLSFMKSNAFNAEESGILFSGVYNFKHLVLSQQSKLESAVESQGETVNESRSPV